MSEDFTNRYNTDPVSSHPPPDKEKGSIHLLMSIISAFDRPGEEKISYVSVSKWYIFFGILTLFPVHLSTHFGLNYWGFPFSSSNTLVQSSKTKKRVFCMLFGYNKNFPKRRKTDSGQIKCLAFRSFNEKKTVFWMNVMREIHWPRSLLKDPKYGTIPIFPFRSQNPNPTKAQGRPDRKRAPLEKKVLQRIFIRIICVVLMCLRRTSLSLSYFPICFEFLGFWWI